MRELSLSQLQSVIPDYVVQIAEDLQKAGFEAFLVGGSLRDVLLGKAPSDYDIATNAYPEQIMEIFEKSIPTGAKFGTVTVVCDSSSGERFDVQVTTYRSEADYMGGRWPVKVEYAKTILEDLSRRDFTINAMALDLQRFDEINSQEQVENLLIDQFDGVAALRLGVIKAVGDPVERFSEDGLRPMRACRLASQLDFEIEESTFEAAKNTNHVTEQVSVERLREELMKLLLKSPKPSKGLFLLRDTGIMKIIIPELLEGVGMTQPEFHVEDVFEHSLHVTDLAEDRIKLAALFHDIGKTRTRTEDENGVHFYGHDQVGAEMTKEIMKRLKFSNAEIDHTVRLVRWHMFYYPSPDWRKESAEGFDYQNATKEQIIEQIELSKKRSVIGGWSDAAIRRLIVNVGGEEAIEDLLRLRIADATANPKTDFNPEEVGVLAERIAEVRSQDMALKIEDLDISGDDLMQELGLQPGPEIGKILQYLLDMVIEDPLLNERVMLLELAKKFQESTSNS